MRTTAESYYVFYEPVKRTHILNHQHEVTCNVSIRIGEMPMFKKKTLMFGEQLRPGRRPEAPRFIDAHQIAGLNYCIGVRTFIVVVKRKESGQGHVAIGHVHHFPEKLRHWGITGFDVLDNLGGIDAINVGYYTPTISDRRNNDLSDDLIAFS